MVRTSNSKDRHRTVSRANRVLSPTSNKVSNLITKRITVTMTMMATAFRTTLITMTTMTAYPMHRMTHPWTVITMESTTTKTTTMTEMA